MAGLASAIIIQQAQAFGRQTLRRFRSYNIKPEFLIVSGLLLISGIIHSWNMFGFPYIENDEATYSSRGYNYVLTGDLDVYTYRYDHSPLGWMLMGPWLVITKPVFDGDIVASGRVLMLLIHLASTYLIYRLGKRFSGGKKVVGVIAGLIFSLTPLGIFFQRRILLDNIMTLFTLASISAAVRSRKRLIDFQLSGLLFAIAVLVKLNAIFFGPAILYLVWQNARKTNRLHAVVQWLVIGGLVVSLFFVYALIKGEFFPAPIDPNTGLPTRVSMIDTFQLQLGRGESHLPWNSQSEFYRAVESWVNKDPIVLLIGGLATIILFFIGIFKKAKRLEYWGSSLLVITMLAFLMRGGLVLNLYITPLIPLTALNIALVLGLLLNPLKRMSHNLTAQYLLVFITFLLFTTSTPNIHLSKNETQNQLAAQNWILDAIPKNAHIISDNYAYPFLNQSHGYENIYYFFASEYDQQVRDRFEYDWRNVDYLVVGHEIVKQIKNGDIKTLKQTLEHSQLIASFREETTSFIDLDSYISTNGDWIEIYKVKDRVAIQKQDSWRYFKENYIIEYGQVIDPTNNNITTSARQAEAMIRAAEERDLATFDGLYTWSNDHLRFRQNDILYSWRWEKSNDGYSLTDSNNVCYADQNIAYALMLAYKFSGNKKYKLDSLELLADVWQYCFSNFRNGRILKASVDGSLNPILINPGYFQPNLYRQFAEFDITHNWQLAIDGGYELNQILLEDFSTLPKWVQLNTETGNISSASNLIVSADDFGEDSALGVAHMAIDAIGSQDQRAIDLLLALNQDYINYTELTNTYGLAAFGLAVDQILKPNQIQYLQNKYQLVIASQYKPESGELGTNADFASQVWFWRWLNIQSELTHQNARRILDV